MVWIETFIRIAQILSLSKRPICLEFKIKKNRLSRQLCARSPEGRSHTSLSMLNTAIVHISQIDTLVIRFHWIICCPFTGWWYDHDADSIHGQYLPNNNITAPRLWTAGSLYTYMFQMSIFGLSHGVGINSLSVAIVPNDTIKRWW